MTKNTKIRKKLNLQKQMFLLLFVMVMIFTALVCVFSFFVYQKSAMRQISKGREDILVQIGERANNIKNSVNTLSGLYYYDSSVNEYLEMDRVTKDYNYILAKKLNRVGEKYQKTFEDLGLNFDICIAADNGLYYNSGEKNDQTWEKLISNIWYGDVVRANGDNYWVCSYPANDSAGDDEKIFSAVRLLRATNGRATGLLMVNVRESCLYQTYQNTLMEHSNIYIVDEKGRVISSNRRSLLGLKYFNVERLLNLFGEMDHTIVDEAGVETFLCRYSDWDIGWTILEETPTSILFISISQFAASLTLIYLAFLPCMFLLTLLIARRFTRPLKQFCKDMYCVEQGNMDFISKIDGWSEIVDIGNGFNRMLRKIQDLILNIKQEEHLKRRAELDYLQAQINPHFIYNTLLSVRCLIGMHREQDAYNMLGDYISLLQMVYQDSWDFITLSEEIDLIQKYVSILTYRYGDTINLIADLEPGTQQYRIPKLLLQPFVENSIIHGIAPVGHEGLIVIQSHVEDKLLIIEIDDNGVGMSEEQLQKLRSSQFSKNKERFNGVGISGAEKRIQLHYGAQYGIRYESDLNCGSRIILTLPFEEPFVSKTEMEQE